MPRSAQFERTAVHLYHPAWDRSTDPLVWSVFEYRDYTHAYVPQDHFDQVRQEGHWTVAERAGAYIALWSWRTPTWRDYDPAVYATRGMVKPFDLVAEGGADNVWIVEVGTVENGRKLDTVLALLRKHDPVVTRSDAGFQVQWVSPAAGKIVRQHGPVHREGQGTATFGLPRHDSRWGTVDHLSTSYALRAGRSRWNADFASLTRPGAVSDAAPLRLAVVGVDHLHLFQIVDGLVRAGAETVAHTPSGSLVDLYRTGATGRGSRASPRSWRTTASTWS